MEKKLPDRQSFWSSAPHRFRAVGLSLLFAMALGGAASGQQIAIAGTVSSEGGDPLSGVTVTVQGTETHAVTGANGKYAVNAPTNGILTFVRFGRKPLQITIAGRAKIDVTMAPIAYLEEVVVTAYAEQRRADITGAVASINIESATRQTGASVLQKLDAVPGITVAASGSPGSRSTVRIRGVSSFQNNDPLYVVDGVPLQDSYINWLNPDDITSVQVLKDASAASIYGSRASNGVIVIETTKRGMAGPPRMTFTARTGVANPTRGYDDFLITNSLDYFQIVKQSYQNAGLPVPTNIYGDPNSPTIPQYTYAAPGTATSVDAFGRPTGVDPSKYSYPNSLIQFGSAGTNWWKAVFSSAPVTDYNLNIAGAGEENAYGISFNYFNQNGTAAYNSFKRGSIRVNTQFSRGKLSFGENVALSGDRHIGGITNDPGGYAEDGIIGKNILMQPVVAVYDVQGNFASGKAVGLGNQGNPLKQAYEARNNENRNNRVFGNVFGGFAPTAALSLRTSFGFNVAQQSFAGFNPISPENSEPTLTNSINENSSQSTDWTWSNTLRYSKSYSQHGINLLLGQEANANTYRFLAGGISGLLSTEVSSRYVQSALGDAASKTVSSTGNQGALLSYFGKADYNFADKYVASATLRRDGSSRLSPANRWGTFPAFGLGWRISKEKFLANNKVITDAMLRYGYGVTGNQSIPSGRIVSGFGGDVGDTYYDITGSNSSVAAGFRQTSLGNENLKWEENRATNVGADVALFDGKINVVLDVYQRNTNNLLFDPRLPGTAGVAAPPIVNIGSMKNRGFDFSIGHQGINWNATLQGSHYKNEIVRIDGVQDFFYGPITTRFGNQVINQVGKPIGSFYGFIADGMFRDAADVKAHAPQDGAAPGRIKFRDVNGDGKITTDDRTIIGNPHPNYTGALDLGFRRGNWDLAGTVFGSFGNDIFDVQKEFYVFRQFSTNVRKDLLTDSWTPEKTDAKYPRLDVNDNYSHAVSSFYVEDGSYVRMRSLQLGYNVPQSIARWMQATRVYLQAENLFTFTGYNGLDPALPAANVTGAAGDIRDQYRGIDRGSYPSSRTFSVGIVTSF
jgi:TonB-linked SusC/RagA family outer membrane protein